MQARLATQRHWRSLQRTTVGSLGRFRFVAHLRGSGRLRVVAGTAPATTTDDGSTGSPGAAPIAAGQTAAGQPVTVLADLSVRRADRAVLAGQPVRVHGRVLPVGGIRRVALQGHAGRHWATIARARTNRSGAFTIAYRPQSGTNRRLRVLFAGDAANARASASAGTVRGLRAGGPSWYYDAGLQTGCGFNARYGVANKSLPCGTKVKLRYGGRTVMATVDDRGPYVAGHTWDLGQSTRAALGFQGVGTIWASVR